MITTIVLTLLAYLLGSLSAAIIVCRLMSLPDPRTQGSHNPGATNVLRIGGKKAAAITLFGDMIKGLIPVLIARAFTDDMLTLCLVAGAAFLGHMFPVFFRFQGGKGVATAFGVLLGVHWPAALVVLVVWLTMVFGFKTSSLGALSAAAALPVAAWSLEGSVEFVGFSLFLSILLIARHHQNIRNLLRGREGKITDPKDDPEQKDT